MRRALALVCLALSLITTALSTTALAEPPQGYYRFPDLHGDTVVFTAEGDLWQVSVAGGTARRLTSHPGQETHAAISPDGTQVAFSADYEGPTEVYVMPMSGGLPQRLTWEGDDATVVGWTPAGEVLYASENYSTLPGSELIAVSPQTLQRHRLPLVKAAEGCFAGDGHTLVFTRFSFHGSHTKRYQGGTAQSLWRYTEGDAEATPLTADFAGTSHAPMCDGDRVYFTSDRPADWQPGAGPLDVRQLGYLNVWSMNLDGSDLRRHTHHQGWDVKGPRLDGGRIVYQLGADLYLLDLAGGEPRKLDITLTSDFDQLRETWVQKPMDYLTSAHLSPDGDRVVLTARGEVFVAPVEPGRFVEVTHSSASRFRSAHFLPDGKHLAALTDTSGEVEVWQLDPRGLAAPEQLTTDGHTLRFDLLPSPDGQWLAYTDKDQELWLLHVSDRRQVRVATSQYFGFGELAWSPDGRWLAFVQPADTSQLSQIHVYDTQEGTSTAVTSDRFDSSSPAWSPDGQWLYFISERNLVTPTSGVWGSYAPQPALDHTSLLFQLALQPDLRSPFAPPQELDATAKDKDTQAQATEKDTPKKDTSKADSSKTGTARTSAAPEVKIDFAGLAERLWQLPVPPGNYSSLSTNGEVLFWVASELSDPARNLMALKVERKAKPATVISGLDGYELSADGKKVLIQKNDQLYVTAAAAAPADSLADKAVPLDGWTFRLDPRQERRQMFVEAWRLARDYFYDPGMHGADWPAMREKYLPVAERVTDRAELSDLFGDLIGELSVLHAYVRRGDFRQSPEQIEPASLGAVLDRDEAAGGYRVSHIYATDPDLPSESSPLARPGVEVHEGDVIVSINGTATLSVPDPGVLLRNQAGKQVLLELRGAGGKSRQAIVEPITPGQATELRYDAWELKRRQLVEEWGGGDIGYVHLRAMTASNYTEWVRHYFPVFQRKGLVLDLRRNHGGNIDSWILGNLLRRQWAWWQPRVGRPYANMQGAFGGHLVLLCDEGTLSDGELFAAGFRSLGLGEIIGTRTWGGEVWLTGSNVLVDNGVVTAPEFGVYGPNGQWLIEGHGVDPDQTVDNLPHATFNGEDAQLRAAVEYLQRRIKEQPPQTPQPPLYPDKSPLP